MGSYTGEVCELVGEKLVLNEDSIGVETSRLDADGRDAQNRVCHLDHILCFDYLGLSLSYLLSPVASIA